GTAPTMGAKALSDTAEVGNGHNIFARVRNTDAEAKVITVVVPGNTEYGVALPDPTFNLGDGSSTPTEVWIPLRKEYADAAGAGVGRCTITISTGTATGVTVAIVKVG
ncbi:MAG TPA: hypothetical protein VLA89_14130, partial [Gemmatimonadales bacterium]|nr:hypothetical protein [Gemmatimonadales bacterium]